MKDDVRKAIDDLQNQIDAIRISRTNDVIGANVDNFILKQKDEEINRLNERWANRGKELGDLKKKLAETEQSYKEDVQRWAEEKEGYKNELKTVKANAEKWFDAGEAQNTENQYNREIIKKLTRQLAWYKARTTKRAKR